MIQIAPPPPAVMNDYSPSASSFRKSPFLKRADKKSVANPEKPFAGADRKKSFDQPPSSRSRPTVSFSKRVRVKKVRSHKHYSTEEKQLTWYSVEEYAEIKLLCIETLKLMMKDSSFTDNEDHCTRGLEVRTRDANKIRKDTKLQATRVVLEEQELQFEEGVNMPERIREKCRETTLISQSAAQFLAMKDRKDAEEYQCQAPRVLSR